MSPKLPVVSGKKVIQVLSYLGYHVVRQRGSHIRLTKSTSVGDHHITVPNHKTIAKGTLNDVLTKVALWNNIPKNELIAMLQDN